MEHKKKTKNVIASAKMLVLISGILTAALIQPPAMKFLSNAAEKTIITEFKPKTTTRMKSNSTDEEKAPEKKAIARIWQGSTSLEQADTFENILRTRVFPGLKRQPIDGYHGAQLLRRETGTTVVFTTIMWFDNLEAVKQFAGEDFETAHIDEEIRSLLQRYDKTSLHSLVAYRDLD